MIVVLDLREPAGARRPMALSALRAGGQEDESTMKKVYRNWKPVDGLPAGLISWFAPGGRTVAMVTYWLAMVGGTHPRVRASWPGRRGDCSLFWPGGDFVLNIPDKKNLQRVSKFVGQGMTCLDIERDLGITPVGGALVQAPRLSTCPVQIECRNGSIDQNLFEPQVLGDPVLMHHAGTLLPVRAGLDVSELLPFSLLSS
jgi:hypothetical protein